MEAKETVLIQRKPTTLFIKWNDLPFKSIYAILWREVYFTIAIDAHLIEFGRTRTLTFSYKGKHYPCRLTKWKQYGGSNGIYPPHIETQSHMLQIKTTLSSIELSDIGKLMPDIIDNQSDSFIVLYQS